MIRTVSLASLCCLFMAGPAVASDDKTTTLEPSSNWHASLEDGRCRLARTFGKGASEHLLVFEQWGPSSRFGLTVAGPATMKFSSGSKTDLTFFDGQEPREIRPVKSRFDKYGTLLTELNAGIEAKEPEPRNWQEADKAEEKSAASGFPSIDLAIAAKSGFARLAQGERTLTFRTGNLKDPFDALNQCAEQLMVSWGLDLAKQKAQSRRPKLVNWRKIHERLFANWPSDMLEESWRGSVHIRVLVNEEGRTDGCQATNMEMTQEMQKATCNSMSRARFEPARDAKSRPMRSFYETMITYRVQ